MMLQLQMGWDLTATTRTFLKLWTLFSVLKLYRTLEIDNSVRGTPEVQCLDGSVQFSIETQKGFYGRIYAEGYDGLPDCSITASPDRSDTRFTINIPVGVCGMQRKRMTGPLRGMAFALEIVVSFHGTFITKVDRSYSVACFFEVEGSLVTQNVDISAIPTTSVFGTDDKPSCSYTIHSGSPDGPVVHYAKVGDPLYHKWECEDKNQRVFVRSCTGTDGRTNEFEFYDKNGCTNDFLVMPPIEYDTTNNIATIESHAFKFSDISVLRLHCILETCDLSKGECEGKTYPPVCEENRVKREASEVEELDGRAKYQEQDVYSDIRVVDSFLDQENSLPDSPQLNRKSESYERTAGVCMTSQEFHVLTFAGLILGVLSLVMGVALCLRWDRFRARTIRLDPKI